MTHTFNATPTRVQPMLRSVAAAAVVIVGSLAAARLIERRAAAARVMPETSWVNVYPGGSSAPALREALPDSIRARVASLLLSHLGTEYSGRLRYVDGGRVIHVEPSAIAPVAGAIVFRGEWLPFHYRLGFELVDPALGGVSYITYVSVDPSGGPMAPLAFPPVRVLRDRARMVALAVARDSASARGLRAPEASLEYSAADSAFHYVFSEEVGERYRYVIIDAHSGRFVRGGEESVWHSEYARTG